MPDSLGFHECGDPCGAPDGYTYNEYMGEGGRGPILWSQWEPESAPPP